MILLIIWGSKLTAWGEKFDLTKICMRGKLVANLATKFALSLHASIFQVCNPLDLQQICQRFARVQIHKYVCNKFAHVQIFCKYED